MNVLSSLLYWIGNTIGYNPNTLTTTDKTIVGAINEVKSEVNAISSNVYTKDDFVIITGSRSVPKLTVESVQYSAAQLAEMGVDNIANYAVIGFSDNGSLGGAVYHINPRFSGLPSGTVGYNNSYPIIATQSGNLNIYLYNGDENGAKTITYRTVLMKVA